MQSFGVDAAAHRHRNKFLKRWDALTNFLEENRQHIFFLFVFYVITIALFIERFVCMYFVTVPFLKDFFLVDHVCIR